MVNMDTLWTSNSSLEYLYKLEELMLQNYTYYDIISLLG